jgi:hypothetical protein
VWTIPGAGVEGTLELSSFFTNASGVIALKLTCPTSPCQNTIVRGSKPVSQGYGKFSDFRVLDMCPTPAQGSADITSLYTSRYGVPPVA